MATKQPKLLPMEIPGPQFIKRVKQWELETGQKYTPPTGSVEARIWKGETPWYSRLDRNQVYTYEDAQDFAKESALVGDQKVGEPLGGLYKQLPEIISTAAQARYEKEALDREKRKDAYAERQYWGGGIKDFDKLTKDQYKEVANQVAVDNEIKKREQIKVDQSEKSTTGSIEASTPGSVTQYSVPNDEDASVINASWNTLPLNLSDQNSRLNVSGKNSVEKNKALISTLPELEKYPEYLRGMDQLSLEMRGEL